MSFGCVHRFGQTSCDTCGQRWYGLAERVERAPMTEEWRGKFEALRDARVSLGLCERCDEPTRPGRLHCATCAAKANAASLARYRAKTGAVPSSRRCSICRVVGHSRRLCPTTEAKP